MKKGMLMGALALAVGMGAARATAYEMPAYTGPFSACTKDGKLVDTTLAAYPGVDMGKDAASISKAILQQFLNQVVGNSTAMQIRSAGVPVKDYWRAMNSADKLLYRDMPAGVSIKSPLAVTDKNCGPEAGPHP